MNAKYSFVMLNVVLILKTTSTTRTETQYSGPGKISPASTTERLHAPGFPPFSIKQMCQGKHNLSGKL